MWSFHRNDDEKRFRKEHSGQINTALPDTVKHILLTERRDAHQEGNGGQGMNPKAQLSIGFGSPCSHQNIATPWAAEKASALDHQNTSGGYSLEKDKWLEVSRCF